MTLRVGISCDLLDSAGRFSFGPGPIQVLDARRDLLHWEMLPPGDVTPVLTGAFDALYINTPLVAASALDGSARVKVIARHGVGTDSVAASALTEHGVLLTNTPLAVRRPVATMALTFMLALAQRLMEKDRLTREGRWHERQDYMGMGLTGRVLGLVGAGSIGRELAVLAAPFDMRVIAADPFAGDDVLVAAGIERVGLGALMDEADFVVVACQLTEATRRLIDGAMLGRMKHTAYLINVARGPIVDEAALIERLRTGAIAGAALDVFEQEPVDPANPLLAMRNVIVTPHALCWTDENFDAIARTAMTSIVDTLDRRLPAHVVNPEALNHPRLRAWFRHQR